MVVLSGCATKMVTLRTVPQSPLVDQLKLTAKGGPQPSERTSRFLRFYDLTGDLKGDPRRLLQKVQEIIDREPSADKIYCIAELSYLEGKRVEADDPKLAADLYGASVLHAYRYLFDRRFRDLRNPYDPQFRGACDLYNGALESALRLLCKEQGLVPNKNHTIHTAAGACDMTVTMTGNWRPEDFGKVEFVSDYEIKGLKNQYQSYGLGVPLIVVRRSYADQPAAARYYPPNLSFPVTAFLRPLPEDGADQAIAGSRLRARLELYDPVATSDTTVAGVTVPLESDLTTPLAYFLSSFTVDLATAGLLRPEALLEMRPNAASTPVMGLYMVQPYEPGKIPVVLVHGLWSSPMTWMAMFNDLRSCPEIRDRYQFWFYLYPTAQPFWASASQFRRDLAEVRQVLDPQRREPALDQMVLVGHSMGGLIAKMQTLHSGDDYWRLASDRPFDQVRADPEVVERLKECFFFEPNPSVRRVITIGTPHRGSSFSNQTTQWLAAKLIRLPQTLMKSRESLFTENPGTFGPQSLLQIETSVDSLAPTAPIFNVMLASARAPWVKYHNVVAVRDESGIWRSLSGHGDGVVEYESAHLEDAASEIIVPADHTTVHTHPLAVLEVRRILLEHLAERRQFPATANVAGSR